MLFSMVYVVKNFTLGKNFYECKRQRGKDWIGKIFWSEKIQNFKLFFCQNHLYHLKALEKLYRRLLRGYSQILYWFWDINTRNHWKLPKIRENKHFWWFQVSISQNQCRIWLYPLKCLLYSFLRAFRWFRWFWQKKSLKFWIFSLQNFLPMQP